MPRLGYTLMTEQSGPRDLVRHAVAAERVGFDLEVSSDRYSLLVEAIEIIRDLHAGGLVTWAGERYWVDSARI